MKVGINLLLWTDAPDSGSFAIFESLKKTGYDCVELPIYDQSLQEITAIGHKLDELELSRTAATTCSPGENLASADSVIRHAGVSALKKRLDRCAVAGCDMLVGPLHSTLGTFTGKFPTEDEFHWSADALYEVAEYAQSVEVHLALEPVNRFECYLVNTVAQGVKLVKLVGHEFCGLMYDTFHAHIEEKDVQKAIVAAKDFLIHVHISENDRGIPGTGQVRWQETFDALRQIEYDGSVVIEAFGSALPKLAAATRIWRPMFTSEQQLVRDGLAFIRKNTE